VTLAVRPCQAQKDIMSMTWLCNSTPVDCLVDSCLLLLLLPDPHCLARGVS
jgi:hypothetical protein